MWEKLAKFVLKNRIYLLSFLFISTAVMGYFASKVKLSYEFTKAIPTDNPKYQDYLSFKEKFGDDGNMLVIGIETDSLFSLPNFAAYQQLTTQLKGVPKVENILSIPTAVRLKKDTASQKLLAERIFADTISNQQTLDSSKNLFFNLPFYQGRLYNEKATSFLMGLHINKDVLITANRTLVVDSIIHLVNTFKSTTGIETHLSGLPLIRTEVANRIQKEMKLFLVASIVLSLLILLLFFRSIGTTLLSMAVVLMGVVWAVGLIEIFGYQISLLTALIPSLVVVIGIPNCIYFLNKYHSSFVKNNNKEQAIINMVSKMGIVTLFCNLSAAIGFAVFAFTNSAILKEFGLVAGISIMVIFFISFILLPSVLSLQKPPTTNELKYLTNKTISHFLDKLEYWVFNYKKTIWVVTSLVLVVAIIGLTKLKTVAFIVDDLPKTDIIYKDLKFFENNFKGVMPLEIIIDSKKNKGLMGMRALKVYDKVDSLALFISQQEGMNRPLSVADGLKFAKQGFFEGDSASYTMPNAFDGAFVAPYLKASKNTDTANNFTRMLSSFIDSNNRYTRMSVNMADVGTEKLPMLLHKIEGRAQELFDSSYNVTLTGSSITFLEGSKFIINGLKESILWAFGLIALCMVILFRSAKIVISSLIPNMVPLIITAGIMGWAGVALKPSTVLIFSVALGIAVDITIRFLVNYKQVLPKYDFEVKAAVKDTIKSTGLSIIYTSLVLVAGFIIFCASSFGGTFALGWLTSVTLVTATLTNLVLLPALLLLLNKKK